MAETKRAGRPKKSETAPKTETKAEDTTKKESPTDETIKQLMALIEEQNKKMAEMQEQIENAKTQTPTVVVSNDISKLQSKKVRLINLMHGVLNLSTEPDGKGRVFTFNNYGESRLANFDDVSNIVASYPHTTEVGAFYIADKDVIDYLGLTEEYSKIYDKELMDKVTLMRDEEAVDLFACMDKTLQNDVALDIAKRINANETVDYNNLNRIKVQCGIDIQQIAEDIKNK